MPRAVNPLTVMEQGRLTRRIMSRKSTDICDICKRL